MSGVFAKNPHLEGVGVYMVVSQRGRDHPPGSCVTSILWLCNVLIMHTLAALEEHSFLVSSVERGLPVTALRLRYIFSL